MSRRRHAAMKPAKAPWIDEIPSHWKEKPFYAVGKERRAKNIGMKEDNLLSLSYGNIIRKDINTPNGLLPASFETYQIVEQDDVVFRLTDLQNDKRSLRSAICSERGIITSAYLAVVSHGVLPAFLNYQMRAYDVQKVFYSMGGGMRQSLGYEDLRRMSVVAPDMEEQTAIARFLDHQTGRIDGLIEKKTRFIALLKEKRAAVITHAVTKGIDPDAPMKDAGNPWIGTVPKHWSVSPLKFLLARSLQYGATEAGDSFRPEWPRYIRITDITMSGKLREDGAKSLDTALARPYLVKHGDLLLARSGATVGKSFLYEGPDDDACFAGYMIRASADREKLLPAYLNFFFQSHTYWEFILGTQSQSTIQNVSAEKYAGLPVTVPSLLEQREICARLQAETGKIDGLITLTERSIDLLREKRSALITAAVTGKIDVRNAA